MGADHGAPGLIAMPTGGYLYADALHDTFKYMHANKMYKEMTVYIEACESGSMFENILEKNLGIYAVTAANAQESSWGAYCSPNDKVNGKSVGSCLGDLFSINWMEDTDKANMSKETLQQQYKIVMKQTSKSHVLQFGDLSFTNEAIGNFESVLGAAQNKTENFWKSLKKIGKDIVKDAVHWDEATAYEKNSFAVDSRDIKLHYLYYQVKEDPSIEHMNALKNNATPNPTEFDCLRDLMDQYDNMCVKFDDYSLKWVKALVAECEGQKSFPEARENSLKVIKNACEGNSYIQSQKKPTA